MRADIVKRNHHTLLGQGYALDILFGYWWHILFNSDWKQCSCE